MGKYHAGNHVHHQMLNEDEHSPLIRKRSPMWLASGPVNKPPAGQRACGKAAKISETVSYQIMARVARY
jgi:hypothetical protein